MDIRINDEVFETFACQLPEEPRELMEDLRNLTQKKNTTPAIWLLSEKMAAKHPTGLKAFEVLYAAALGVTPKPRVMSKNYHGTRSTNPYDRANRSNQLARFERALEVWHKMPMKRFMRINEIVELTGYRATTLNGYLNWLGSVGLIDTQIVNLQNVKNYRRKDVTPPELESLI